MEFGLTKEQELVKQMVKNFALNEVKDKKMYLETAQKFVEEGRGSSILPFLFMGFSPMCAKTLLDFYNAENLKNCPVVSSVGETKSLKKIRINLCYVSCLIDADIAHCYSILY